MNRHLVTLAKVALAALLMWYVLGKVDFEDRLVTHRGEQEHTQVIDIQGSWQANPIRYTTAGTAQEQSVTPGPQADGTKVTVKPGFLTYWHSLDPWLFVLGALCYFLTALIASARWWWLLRVNGTDVSLWETVRFTWIGIFFNNVMPGSTGGDVVKALYIMKRCPGHRVQVMVSVIVDRVLGLGSLALLGAIVVLFALDHCADLAVVIWSVIVGVGLLGCIAFSKRLRSLVRLNALLQRLPHKLGHVLRLIDQAIFFYRDHKWVITWSLIAGIGNHIVSVGSVVLMGKALGVGLPTLDYFVLIPIVNIVSAAPVAPNGWGLGEAVYQGLFSRYGEQCLPGVANAAEVMGTRGVALSVLYRLHLILWSLLGGVLVLLEKDKVTKADLEREQELEDEEDRMAPPGNGG